MTPTRDDSPRALRERSRVRTDTPTRAYESQLRKVARIVGSLTAQANAPDVLQQLLAAYAEALQPWATHTAWRMLLDVEGRSRITWRALGESISFGLRQELERTPVGVRMRELLGEQVTQIKSIPLAAAERVGKLALQAVVEGGRARQIAEEIARTGEVSKSSAIRLARTSVSSAATSLMEARAEAIGSQGYVWETTRDMDVRPSHRAMQGRFVRWDAPPTLDGYTAHAGQFANCRCWTRPVIPLE